ncbi:MAG: imidazole glycerol phosphate synthase subunit HisH [Acidimicrobiales bacterium]|nr:imidazole glycerol phosphate synthase subunit HisH [Acidimicrobiales bacterium]
MSDGTIAVLDYGIGNLGSAYKALVHLGARAELVTSPAEVRGAAGIVLPGVGAFGPCVTSLRRAGFAEVVTAALAAEVPLLAICVGLQMLYEGSEEDPATAGLGVLPGMVRALPGSVKRPQMQWNRLEPTTSSSRLVEALGEHRWVYFVHSYAAEASPEVVATCDYGGPVVAAVERGSLWGTQFHPEKSGQSGLALLSGFVAACQYRPAR